MWSRTRPDALEKYVVQIVCDLESLGDGGSLLSLNIESGKITQVPH